MNNLNQALDHSSLPAVPHYRYRKPVTPIQQSGFMLYTSGHGPEDQISGKPIYEGRIGQNLTPKEG